MSGPFAETAGPTGEHPAWCAQTHPADGEHVSAPLVVLLPFDEQISALLYAEDVDPEHVSAELVHSAVGWPATRALEDNAVAWLALPASHLAELGVVLLELAARIPGGTS